MRPSHMPARTCKGLMNLGAFDAASSPSFATLSTPCHSRLLMIANQAHSWVSSAHRIRWMQRPRAMQRPGSAFRGCTSAEAGGERCGVQTRCHVAKRGGQWCRRDKSGAKIAPFKSGTAAAVEKCWSHGDWAEIPFALDFSRPLRRGPHRRRQRSASWRRVCTVALLGLCRCCRSSMPGAPLQQR